MVGPYCGYHGTQEINYLLILLRFWIVSYLETEVVLRKIGYSELMVSPIGLGCWQFSKRRGLSGKYWGMLDDNEISGIVEESCNCGINWFDTAEVYGWGESERALSATLKRLGDSCGDAIVATKWWPVFRTARSITTTIGKRLDALNTSCIDLYQVHNRFSFSSIQAEMKAMAKLVKDGKIRYVGVSNFSANQMKRAHSDLLERGLGLVSNQVNYSLLNRKIETNGILQAAKDLDITIIAHTPLARGLLTGKFHDDPDLIKTREGLRKYQSAFKRRGLEKSYPVITALGRLAGKYRVSISQIALNWLINFNGNRVVAIPGATSVEQAKSNADSMRFTLTEKDLDYLDEVSSEFKS
jgi:aryl-alcohol dehydrogenase-like predicted oxidoreductase